MPRCVRNFWVECEVDGKETRFASGPRSKDGGFLLRVKVRDNGSVTHALSVTGYVDSQGKLILESDERVNFGIIHNEYNTRKGQTIRQEFER